MRHPRILEVPDHVQDHIDLPQLCQQGPLSIAILPRPAEGGKVQHLEGDGSDLLGAEEGCEAVQAGLREPRLSGFRISFTYVDNKSVRRDFTGRVTGNSMEGSFRTDNGQEGRWSATKK